MGTSWAKKIEREMNKYRSNNKGQTVTLSNLLATGVVFAVAVLALSLVTGVIGDVRDGQTTNEADYNVTSRGLTGMLNLSAQFGNMGTVIAIVVIIGLLLGAFAVFRARA